MNRLGKHQRKSDSSMRQSVELSTCRGTDGMKRPNLADVAAAAGSTRRQTPLPQPNETPSPTTRPVRTRLGTNKVAAHFPADVPWQLRALAVERRLTAQDLMAEALNDLFEVRQTGARADRRRSPKLIVSTD